MQRAGNLFPEITSWANLLRACTSSQGVNFLGYRLFTDHRRLRRDSVKRMKHRMRTMQAQYACGELSIQKITERIRSWIGHAQHADTYRLREHILGDFPFCRKRESQDVDESGTGESPGDPEADGLGRQESDALGDLDWLV